MQVAKNAVVSIAYVLRDTDGEILDQSSEEQPLAYLHGHGGLIAGMEAALDGKAKGEEFSCRIEPEDAYGAYDPNLDLAIAKEAFSEEQLGMLEPGVQFQGPHPENETEAVIYTVHEVKEDVIHASGNHQLAGRTLCFDVTVVDIREATDEELEHGHAHEPGGHQH